MATLVVPVSRFESLQKKLNRIINKCAKAHVPFTCEVSDPFKTPVHVWYRNPEDHTEICVMEDLTCVSVNLDLLYHIDGWEVLGVVGEKDGVKQTYFRDADLCSRFKDSDIHYCDHCHTHRRRKSIVILRDSNGNIKKVGSTCCQEFTHGIDGSLCSEFCGIYGEVLSIAVDCDNAIYDNMETYRKRCFEKEVKSLFAVTVAAYLIEKEGYVSVSRAYGEGTYSTAYKLNKFMTECIGKIVIHSIDNKKPYDSYTVQEMLEVSVPDIEPETVEIAKDAFDWCKNLTDADCNSSYLFNLREICRTETLNGYMSLSWMITSLIPTYLREIENKKREALKAQENTGDYLFEVGQRVTETVMVKDHKTYSSYAYNGEECTKHIYTFILNGNTLVWFTEKRLSCNIGDSLKLTGTVKEHKEFNSVKQTIMTRCKIASL